jgi:predicted enzyme related to lactoylglutathione lyase
MIAGLHTILYSKKADSVRAFFRDVLEFRSVDAGHGWLIFAAPPSEIAIHPTEERGSAELYLMCTDVEATVAKLKERGVEFTMPIKDQGWGRLTQLALPDGQPLGLYEPRHPTAIRMTGGSAAGSLNKKISAKKTSATRLRATKKKKDRSANSLSGPLR